MTQGGDQGPRPYPFFGTLRACAPGSVVGPYRRIDKYEAVEVTLNVLPQNPPVCGGSSVITEQRLYIQAVSDALQETVTGSSGVRDPVEADGMVSDREVGLGPVSIQSFAHFLFGADGMVRSKEGLRAPHRIDSTVEGLLSDRTERLEDEVVLRKVQEVMSTSRRSAGSSTNSEPRQGKRSRVTRMLQWRR